MPILQTIEKTIRQHHLLVPTAHVFVAVSGGADSVCLLLALKQLGYRVEALHCNFHLRGDESNSDEQFVRQLCRTNNIPLYVKQFDTHAHVHINKVSIEMAARQLRYQWFAQMMHIHAVNAICVAHHRQDQAETLLLNLLRGTGLRGLAAMHYKHPIPSDHSTLSPADESDVSPIYVLRPMLDVTRSDIEAYLTALHQTWVTDSTNLKHDALRNRIRLDILPLLTQINPQAVNNIAHTATIVQETLPYLDEVLPQIDTTAIDDQRFMAENLTQLFEIVRSCGFTRQQLQDILTAKTGAIVESTTHRLLRDRESFILRNKLHHALPPVLHTEAFTYEEPIRLERHEACFDADALQQPLTVRPIEQGDRMQPFGMKGTRLLSDIMTDLKLNHFEKEDQHVLVDASGRILWLIGYRTSEFCKVTRTTKSILKITL